MREILSDETFQLALITIKDSNMPLEGKNEDKDEAIASVRRLSRIAGFNNAIVMLLGMGIPVPAKEVEEQPTYEPEPV